MVSLVCAPPRHSYSQAPPGDMDKSSSATHKPAAERPSGRSATPSTPQPSFNAAEVKQYLNKRWEDMIKEAHNPNPNPNPNQRVHLYKSTDKAWSNTQPPVTIAWGRTGKGPALATGEDFKK
ncbi:hypothetical protein SeMB42_g02004 [Synchytrium endobioticum]|uniref:Uncharacterized protein n=1 Tax=Synchytrium endobioticum TaxID=286115 RepID=A0A507DJ23_9FUNG|nr:hypothetical protein SeLEV6574_g04296 [Synchytrium endobioticum]TPX51217.1 hypothetical protein SeMB42_g02004 [Synchytrium endobioticum]